MVENGHTQFPAINAVRLPEYIGTARWLLKRGTGGRMNKEFCADIGLDNRFLVMLIADVLFVAQFAMFTHVQVYLPRDIAIDVEQKCWRIIKMEKHYTHESKELNALLGKKVKVTLFDDTTITGILTRAEWKPDRYEVADYSFRKSHVKKIEVKGR